MESLLMACEFLFNYKFLNTHIPNYCGYYKDKCLKQCEKYKYPFSKGKDERLKYLKQQVANETINFTEEAYELYWKHVEPNDVENENLRERLIQIINSEERANENWRLYK
jgi:hypothetical protein